MGNYEHKLKALLKACTNVINFLNGSSKVSVSHVYVPLVDAVAEFDNYETTAIKEETKQYAECEHYKNLKDGDFFCEKCNKTITPASKEKPDFEKAFDKWKTILDRDKGEVTYSWTVLAEMFNDFSEENKRIWNDHVEPAKAWSEKQNAFIEKLSQENESQREQIAALQEEIRQLKEHSEETFKMVENAVVSGNYDTTTGENLELLSIHLRQLKNKQ